MHPRDETAPRHRRSGSPDVRPRAALLATLVVLGASLTGVVLAVAGPRPDPADARSDGGGAGPARGRSLPEQPGTVGAHPDVGDRRPSSLPSEPDHGPTPSTAHPASGAVVRAADVLRAWDAARARAWAVGDVAALRDLYVDRAGVADVRLLRRYADRGLRVEGLTTQLLAVTVLEHAPGRWRLRVTDRLAGGVAVRDGRRVRLPRDEPDTHVVVLTREEGGRWRVARTRTA